MSISSEEQMYLERFPMRRLSFDGFNDLYLHPRYGAHTIKDCMEKDSFISDLIKPVVLTQQFEIQVSDELSIRHENCVDNFGCGLL